MMNSPRCALFGLGVLTSILLFVTACESREKKIGPLTLRSPGAGMSVGMAEIDITPPVGYRMVGYFDERFATGVHDKLKAKAIVMREGNEDVALVFCDVVGVALKTTAEARAKASAKTGIPI